MRTAEGWKARWSELNGRGCLDMTALSIIICDIPIILCANNVVSESINSMLVCLSMHCLEQKRSYAGTGEVGLV